MAVMSPTDRIDELLTFFDFSPAQLAKALGVPRQAVAKWAARKAEPRGVNRAELERLIALKELLLDRKGSVHAAQAWLAAPNGAFNDETPRQMILEHGPQEVLDYLKMPDEPAYA